MDERLSVSGLLCRLLALLAGLAQAFPAMHAASTPATNPEPLRWTLQTNRTAGFERLDTHRTGLTFAHTVPAARSLTNQMLLDGAGVAIGDIDRDDRPDIFFAAVHGGSELWRSLGDWRFESVTARAFANRADLEGDVTGAAFGDLNGDRSPDLVLNTHADGIRILLNNGQGSFRSLPFVQARARGGHSVSMADVDGDGWLDIYVCNYRQRALMDMPSARASFRTVNGLQVVSAIDGRPTTSPDLTNRFVVTSGGGLDELGEPDVLYRNVGGTNFVEVLWTGGEFLDEGGMPLLSPPWDWGLAAQFCDINGDGRPDLYVCNDFQTPDRFWFNESSAGRIRFRLAPGPTLRHTSMFSMGVDFADVNRDSRWDFFVLDMLSPDHVRRLTTLDGIPGAGNRPMDPLFRTQVDANTLFLQRPDGSFAEVAHFAGVMATDWSWTPAFMDVDLDGWIDLLVTAGQERGSRDLDIADHMKAFRRAGLRTDAQIFRERLKYPSHAAPLKAFRNRCSEAPGSVPWFEDTSALWGFNHPGVSHGMALEDLDGDGDLDVVVNHLNAPAGLYRNLASGPRIGIWLEGQTPNTCVVGATLRFRWESSAASPGLPQMAQITSGGRYLSSDGFFRMFACPGEGRGVLEIRWPGGKTSVYTGLEANHRYRIKEPAAGDATGEAAFQSPKPVPRLRFVPRSVDIGTHLSRLADSSRQSSLPKRVSRASSGLAVTGMGSSNAAVWVGGESQPLVRIPVAKDGAIPTAGSVANVRSGAGLLPWGKSLLVGSDGLKTNPAAGSSATLVDPESGSETFSPTSVSSLNCMALSDDAPTHGTRLFLGGGPLPEDYPNSASSELLTWDGKMFHSLGTTNLGIVTGVLFAELDGNRGPELVTVGEWGSPRIFRITGGTLEGWDPVVSLPGERSGSNTLSVLTGLWQCVAATDMDHDGRRDLILGNWGLNSIHALYAGRSFETGGGIRPLSLLHGNPGGAPRLCLEVYSDSEGRQWPVHGLSRWSQFLPWLGGRFSSHRAFAMAGVPEILRDQTDRLARLECRWMSSLVLLNRGKTFEARPLPDRAQLGPVRSLSVGDFDGDGLIDIYGAQGFFGHNFGRMRDDAGEGFFLMGRADGGLDSLTTGEAGFRLLGEQCSSVAGDLDGDGRPELIVREDGGPVTVLWNQRIQ